MGIDLNDYACALARARLVMTALERCGETDLAAASDFHPQVYWADALEQVERDEWQQLGLGLDGGSREKPRAMLTRPEVRTALRPLLKAGFHVVVGNPPYITEKDPKQKEYHREKVGRGRRYVSASGKYSLGAPFTERMFQLAVTDGYVGQITANSFMKREFGKALIEQVLARKDLQKVVDASGMILPNHGTPTVLLFGRERTPTAQTVRVVMGKRGELGKGVDPAQGKVWSGIVEGHEKPGFETDYISVADVARSAMAKHEWSIGGGGAAELKFRLDGSGVSTLDSLADAIGVMCVSGEDDFFVRETVRDFERHAVDESHVKAFVPGDLVRDWCLRSRAILWPGQSKKAAASLAVNPNVWRYRQVLSCGLCLTQTKAKRGLQMVRINGRSSRTSSHVSFLSPSAKSPPTTTSRSILMAKSSTAPPPSSNSRPMRPRRIVLLSWRN